MANITGEEKHYQKLNKRLQQDLKELMFRLEEIESKYANLHNEKTLVEKDMQQINKENIELKAITNMDEETIKKLIRSSESLESLGAMFKLVSRYWYDKWLISIIRLVIIVW